MDAAAVRTEARAFLLGLSDEALQATTKRTLREDLSKKLNAPLSKEFIAACNAEVDAFMASRNEGGAEAGAPAEDAAAPPPAAAKPAAPRKRRAASPKVVVVSDDDEDLEAGGSEEEDSSDFETDEEDDGAKPWSGKAKKKKAAAKAKPSKAASATAGRKKPKAEAPAAAAAAAGGRGGSGAAAELDIGALADKVLVTLHGEEPGGKTAGDVSKALGVTKSEANKALYRLEGQKRAAKAAGGGAEAFARPPRWLPASAAANPPAVAAAAPHPPAVAAAAPAAAAPAAAGGAAAAAAAAPVAAQADGSITVADLGGNKRVTVATYKGKPLVSLREYYQNDGAWLPGKKGISLPPDVWRAVVGAAPAVAAALAALK